MLAQAENLKGTNVIIKEHLTGKNVKHFFQAKQKRKLMQSTSITKCNFSIKINGTYP